MSGIGCVVNKEIPYYFYMGSCVSIGNDIYILGGSNSSTNNYKYNTDTGIYTKLTNIPYIFYGGNSVAIGTDIYLFGSYNSSSNKYNYKYDTLTDTYTRLTDIPYNFRSGSTVVVGTDIYIFGSNYSSSYYRYAYKYNTLTDTYTKLTNIPYDFYLGGAVAVGNIIYLFGGYEDSTYSYKYDITTGVYTNLTNIPYYFYSGCAVTIGTNIYLLGSDSSSSKKYAYKYDTSSSIYTRLNDIPYNFNVGNAVVSNNNIYLLGGDSFPKYNCKYGAFTYDMSGGKIENVKYIKSSGVGGQFLADNGNYYPLNSYGTTGGSSTAYTCAISSITSYTDGLEVTILPHIDCGSSPTLKINSLSALTIKNSSGETLKAGDIKAGVPVSLVRVGSYFFIRGGGGGGKAKPNIFVQTTEPTTKDGVWINSGNEYDGIVDFNDTIFSEGYSYNTDIPYKFAMGCVSVIGSDIYMFGGSASGSQNAYKYNTLTDTYTKLTDIPHVFFSGSSVVVGTDIYLFNVLTPENSYYTYVYKYNTLTNTYIQLTNTIYSFCNGGAISIGTNIYLFGVTLENENSDKIVYKYDTINNTYTRLADCPYEYLGRPVAIGSNIYLFGFGDFYSEEKGTIFSNVYVYKYDTINNTYTRLADCPYEYFFKYGSVIVSDGNIYLFKGTTAYRYEVLTNKYTQLMGNDGVFNSSGIAVVNDDVFGNIIYLLGGYDNLNFQRNNIIYGTLISSPYKIVFRTKSIPSKYTIKLYNTDYSVINKFSFDDVFQTNSLGVRYKKGDVSYYYGNGTSWIQIT